MITSFTILMTRYHCNYDGLHLNDKGATMFTENIISALNEVARPQCLRNSSSKSFLITIIYVLKEMLSRQLKVFKGSTLKIYFLVI